MHVEDSQISKILKLEKYKIYETPEWRNVKNNKVQM